jgi:hypothetical protein
MAVIAENDKEPTAPGRPPRLVRGSLVTLRRKCGKPACHCSDGEQLHENVALSVSEAGRTRIVALRPADVPTVAAALGRYAAAREKLEAQADAGVEALRAWVATRRDRERRR